MPTSKKHLIVSKALYPGIKALESFLQHQSFEGTESVMKYFGALLLALAVYQASAKPEPNHTFQTNSINTGCGLSLPVTHIQTAVVENPTVNFPTCIPPSAISESCHCMRTLVRPQIRNEIISVPTVDRIVRTVATPIVETINCGGGSRLATFPPTTSILSGTGSSFSDAIQCNNLGNSRSTVIFTDANSGRSFTTSQNTNGATSGLVARPSIITFQTSNGGNNQGFTNLISGSNGCSTGSKTVGSNLHVILK